MCFERPYNHGMTRGVRRSAFITLCLVSGCGGPPATPTETPTLPGLRPDISVACNVEPTFRCGATLVGEDLTTPDENSVKLSHEMISSVLRLESHSPTDSPSPLDGSQQRISLLLIRERHLAVRDDAMFPVLYKPRPIRILNMLLPRRYERAESR